MKVMIAAVLAVFTLTSCATYLDVQRDQKPIYEVIAEKPGVGLLHVEVPDEVLARAPNDFSNMTGLIAKAMRDYTDGRGSFVAVDYTHLGYHPKWERVTTGSDRLPPFRVTSLEGVPAGAQTPLVTVVRVVDWRTTTETVNSQARDVAHVQLIVSTWTREGREVNSEMVDALARSGEVMLFLKAGSQNLVTWYQKSDGHKTLSTNPGKRDELFFLVMHEAVNLHLYPYFSHKVGDRLVLVDDEPYKPGVQAALRGAYDEAEGLWKALADKDPKAHGALYNMAMMKLIRGDDEGAAALLRQASAIDDKFLYGGMLTDIEARLKMHKKIGPAGISVSQLMR